MGNPILMDGGGAIWSRAIGKSFPIDLNNELNCIVSKLFEFFYNFKIKFCRNLKSLFN